MADQSFERQGKVAIGKNYAEQKTGSCGLH